MADEDLKRFESLIVNMLNVDNTLRSQAEEQYENIENVICTDYLLKTMASGTLSPEGRSLAAVLLRRLLNASFDDIWTKLDETQRASLKTQAINLLKTSQDSVIQRKYTDAVSELIRNLTDDSGVTTQWPEVLSIIFECGCAQDSTLREMALRIIDNVPSFLGDQATVYVDHLKQLFGICLSDETNESVRYSAVKATAAFFISNEIDSITHSMVRDLVPLLVKVTAESILHHEDDTVLKAMIDLADSQPKCLRSELLHVLDMCLKANSDITFPDDWRQLALELVVTLTESAPAMVRKQGAAHIPALVTQMLAMMTELDDDITEWLVADDSEEEDTDSNAVTGESSLDRVCCSLGGKAVFSIIRSHLQPMLTHEDWKYRHAALMALSACAEGCKKQMEPILVEIVIAINPFFTDQHPRVRYAVANAIGQLSTDFGSTFQKKLHDKVVPNLIRAMSDMSTPRVQAHSAAAFVNFCEECPKYILAPYLDDVMTTLEAVLSARLQQLSVSGNIKLVVEQFVTTLAAVADAAQDKFCLYYDKIMPGLKSIMHNTVDASTGKCVEELRLLRGKTIECISLIGVAVGKEKFIADASEVMNELLKVQSQDSSELDATDPQISYMIAASARLCTVLGRDFEQYLPVVMGPVLKAASVSPEMTVVEEDDKDDYDPDDWQFISLEDKNCFGIRTAQLEDKATACEMLVCYAKELKGGFSEYVKPVTTLMIPLLKFYFQERCRIAASEVMPLLLDCASANGVAQVSELWTLICPKLLEAIDKEIDADVKQEQMQSFAECIEKVHPIFKQHGLPLMSEETMASLVRILDETFVRHFKNQQKRLELRNDEDYDEGVQETLEEECVDDTWVLAKLSEILHALFAALGAGFLPLFENSFLPHLLTLAGGSQPSSDRQWALCTWCDVIEYASQPGLQSLKFLPHFGPIFLEGCSSDNPAVCQAAFYGFGVMAQFGGVDYIPLITDALPKIDTYIASKPPPGSREPGDETSALDNAVSAVTKICRFLPQIRDMSTYGAQWLALLPITEDEEECVHVYDYLCELVESNHPVILGTNNSNLPRILSIFADVLSKEALPDTTPVHYRIFSLIQRVQSDPILSQACQAGLSTEHLKALEEAIVKYQKQLTVNGHTSGTA